MKLISRGEAVDLGLRLYYTGVPCKYGHDAPRRVNNYGCDECGKIATRRCMRKDRCANPEKHRRRNFEWAEKNREHTRRQARKWRRDNPEKAKAQEQCPKRKAARAKRVKENLPYYAAAAAKRRAAKKSGTPPWANQAKIDKIYMLAAWASKFTNESLEVDHVIPLQGDGICGLHVEDNLQILPKSENIRKFNHWRD